jgi:hypothetical protein
VILIWLRTVTFRHPEPGDANGGESPHEERQDADWQRLLAQLAPLAEDDGWVTLDEASSAAGVARSSLRSWYRAGLVASRMIPGPHGPQRVMPLDAVLERALRSARVRRQLDHAKSLEAEVEELRRRVEALERYLGVE